MRACVLCLSLSTRSPAVRTRAVVRSKCSAAMTRCSRRLQAALAAALAIGTRGFDTALGGSAAEQTTFTQLGAGTLQLQAPLTDIDPLVRACGVWWRGCSTP